MQELSLIEISYIFSMPLTAVVQYSISVDDGS